MLGSGEKIQMIRDCKTISKSIVSTNLSPFISRVVITRVTGEKMRTTPVAKTFRKTNEDASNANFPVSTGEPAGNRPKNVRQRTGAQTRA